MLKNVHLAKKPSEPPSKSAFSLNVFCNGVMAVIHIFNCHRVAVLKNPDWLHLFFSNNAGYFFDRIGQNET
jgi:hypothetical protein